jgi:tripartite-type tricarboxylate transporter receptor subunit TctC
MLFSRTEIGRPYFVPPEVPAPRVEALRRAFDATMRDEGFRADVAKIGFELNPQTGEQIQALIAELANTSPEIIARVRKVLEPQ